MVSLFVKNMVCPRCIMAVKDELDQLQIPYSRVELGKITLPKSLDIPEIQRLADSLRDCGFELLEERKSTLVSQIKTLLIEQIQHSEELLTENYSNFISERLHHEYTYLSKLFSQEEGITIEKYIIRLKMERVKELIFYKEKSLSEIATLLGYNSVAYLSAQFKKEIGMTISAFKRQTALGRNSLDEL
ncbi:MAG: AraC family transcriptional regulator [Algoriphagus sp.]